MTAAVDLKTPATLPIRLGSSILQNKSAEQKGTQWSSIRYNHKPRLSGSEAVIKPGKESGEGRLVLEGDNGKQYKFTGQNGPAPSDSYVLVVRGTGKDKEAVLERISTRHAFNLIQSPAQSDAAKLEAQYPHIALEEDDQSPENGDGLFGDEDETAEAPDPENPFDFRHFLKAASTEDEGPKDRGLESRKRVAETQMSRSGAGTPTSASQPLKRAPLERSASASGGTSIFQKKKKVVPAPTRPAPYSAAKEKEKIIRIPPSSESTTRPVSPPARTSAPSRQKAAEVPRVRLERKATAPSLALPPAPSPRDEPEASDGELVLDGEDDDDDHEPTNNHTYSDDGDDDTGELILEDFDSAKPSKPRHRPGAMSLALSGQLGQGPISLHSAVNSPAAGHFASHSPRHPLRSAHAAESGQEFEFGLDDDEDDEVEETRPRSPPRDHGRPRSMRHAAEEVEQEDDASDFDDADVEDLELPSPAQVHVPNVSATTVSNDPPPAAAAGDDEDDLDMQLALALGEADEPAPVAAAESDEESEEE